MLAALHLHFEFFEDVYTTNNIAGEIIGMKLCSGGTCRTFLKTTARAITHIAATTDTLVSSFIFRLFLYYVCFAYI